MYFMYPGPNIESRTRIHRSQDTYRIQYSEGYTQDTSGYIRTLGGGMVRGMVRASRVRARYAYGAEEIYPYFSKFDPNLTL